MEKSNRLVSLDLLRGLDIFLLTVVCGIFSGIHGIWPQPDWLLAQFRHPAWVGFSTHDLIMPLFIFMTGAALPLALKKRLNPDGSAGWTYWRHVLSRVAMLWFWGLCVQGCLLSFDLTKISFFNNTLQTIAVGYLITAAVARIPSKTVRIAFPFLLAALYTSLVHGLGDLTPTGNFAVVYETKLLKFFYPSFYWDKLCITQIADWHYTWWPTVPMFGAMALAGYHATEIILAPATGMQKTARLAAVGLGLLALGGLLLTFDPCVKHIFTASFTALAMGCNFIFFAVCYYCADVRGVRRGQSLVLLFGRHSLLAYLLGSVLSAPVRSLTRRFLCDGQGDFSHGLMRFVSEPVATLIMTVCSAAILCFTLWAWHEWQLRTSRRNTQPPSAGS